jgi:hypothetical protein
VVRAIGVSSTPSSFNCISPHFAETIDDDCGGNFVGEGRQYAAGRR